MRIKIKFSSKNGLSWAGLGFQSLAHFKALFNYKWPLAGPLNTPNPMSGFIVIGVFVIVTTVRNTLHVRKIPHC